MGTTTEKDAPRRAVQPDRGQTVPARRASAATGALELQRPNVSHLHDALLRGNDSSGGLKLREIPAEPSSQHGGWLRHPPK
eukprot:8871961-Alexandrium_andersonii.AAC.1